ncbi:MAG: helix-turn-helix transcriptional regulator [Acidobacteriota bacterium]|nr:helix-turn-helix transcriptional regulator [Acidobacteriota bacterium]
MRRPNDHASLPAGHLPLTPVEFHVLLSIAGGDRHGYAILQEVAERTGDQLRLRTGTLYTVIKRMLDRGWLVETDGSADADERRRYYRLTPPGREVVRAEARRLQALVAVAHEKHLLGPRVKPAPGRGR